MSEGPEWIRLDIAAAKRLIETWSMAARGCFFSLMLCQIERGSLPRDLNAIERLVPGTKRVWSEIASAFVERDGVMLNEDYDRRRTDAIAKIESYRQRGRDGMASRYGHEPGDEGGRRSNDRRRPATSSARSSATNTATSSAITQQVVSMSMSMSEEYSPASSSCSVVPERTTHEVGSIQPNHAEPSPRLKLAIAKLPASLTDDEHREAVEVLATWPDASVLSDLNRLIEQARDADLPNVYLMSCLRKRRRERQVDPVRPTIAGRIDPALAKTYKDDETVKAERAQVDAVLAGLSEAAFDSLRARALGTFEPGTRSFVERADPKKSIVLRAAMASLLAQENQQPHAATA